MHTSYSNFQLYSFLLLIILASTVLISCDRTIYVDGTIHLTDYVEEDDRSFGYDGESIGQGQELPWEQGPVVSFQLSSELEEVVVTDVMTILVGVRVELGSYSGEIDLDLHLKAYISDLEAPEIWSDLPAFEFTLEHVQDYGTNYEESSFDLLEQFQNVLYSAERVSFALEATLENHGVAGSYSGSFIIETIDIHYEGHKEL